MLGARGIRRDERQIDFGFLGRRKLDLRLFRGFLQALQRKLVAAQVNALFLAEFIGQIINDALVEILTTQEGVTIGGFHFKHAIADFQHGNVEGAATKVINRDGAALFLFHTIGQRGGRRFIDDAQHFKPGNGAGFLGGLALGVIEIGRNGNHGLGNLLTQMGFGGFLHFGQHHGADLLRRVGLAVHLNPGVAIGGLGDREGGKPDIFLHHRVIKAAANQALHRIKRAHGVGDGLALRRLPDQPFAILRKRDHGRRGARTFGVFNDAHILAFKNGDAGIGGAKVNTDNLTHPSSPLWRIAAAQHGTTAIP